MSEKKVKKTLDYPIYQMENLMDIVCGICKTAGDFPPQHLVNLIIQDWLIMFFKGQAKGMSPSDILVTYVKSTQKNSDLITKLKKDSGAKK